MSVNKEKIKQFFLVEYSKLLGIQNYWVFKIIGYSKLYFAILSRGEHAVI